MVNKVLVKIKRQYFSGTLSEEELKERGWEPNPLRILHDDIDHFVQGDPEIVALSLKIGLQEEKIGLLESILRVIMGRGYIIKNAIDLLKFENGIN